MVNFYQAPFISLDPRLDDVFVVVWHNAALDLSGTFSLLNHDRHMGSMGGKGFCSGEKDIAAKPLWKMPTFAIVGSQ